jgi:glycosyltransferase involved in cell wall biosynthesis
MKTLTMYGSTQSEPHALSGLSILVIGTDSWFAPLLSKHHIVLELCQRNNVLYMEPHYHVGKLLRGCLPAHIKHEAYHNRQPPTLSRLTPMLLPKSSALPSIRWLSDKIVSAQLRLRGFRPDVIISFSPYFSFLANRKNSKFVYYCVDTHVDQASESETLARADLVIAATEKLYNLFRGRTRRLEYLPHGVNLDVISVGIRNIPPEIAMLPRPVVGFVGSIGPHLDIPLLVRLARSNPEVSIVLVGPYERGSFGAGLSEESLARLRAESNIHLLGPKPSEQLGAYINAIDVGLVSKDTSHPLVHFSYSKILQYLAMGKPVVTTCFAQKSILPPHVTVAGNHNDFIEAVRCALRNHDEVARDQCHAFAREHTWEKQVARLSQWIQEVSEST